MFKGHHLHLPMEQLAQAELRLRDIFLVVVAGLLKAQERQVLVVTGAVVLVAHQAAITLELLDQQIAVAVAAAVIIKRLIQQAAQVALAW